MRLLNVTVLGTALVTAGLAAPATGQATGRRHIAFSPEVAHPGQRVDLILRSCPDGRTLRRASSAAFTGDAPLSGGRGTATIAPTASKGTYKVVARCGSRQVTGSLNVSSARTWRSMLREARGGSPRHRPALLSSAK